MIDKPLYQNPLGGGLGQIISNPGAGNVPRGGGSVTDTRDRTFQNPYEFGGAGMLGLASAIDGSGGGALFLNDESRPRSEEDIRNRYEQAKAQAAESRRNGFLGQVVLPGEQSFDQFKAFSGNSFFLKRNPNIPESAYGNFDLTNIGGFDNPATDGGPTPPPGSGTPMNPFPGQIDTPEQLIESGQFTLGLPPSNNPFNRVGQQLTGPDQFGDLNSRLNKLEEGIGSLLNQNRGFGFNSMQPRYGAPNYGYSPFSMTGLGSLFGGYYG